MTPKDIPALPYRPCVGIMLANDEGRVFVGQRIDNPGPAWQMPQGGIDPGEDPREAALRELWEETGVVAEMVEIEAETAGWIPYDLPPDLAGKLWKGRYRGQEQKWFLMRFRGTDSDVNIATAHPEFSRWQWMAASDLVDNIVPFKRDVYRAVLAELGGRL
ncbi:RNA pyrophosphohydrolase [Primorskyibacter flagellatus]|uniref:RNA pyrophosphohydrolase n=1 Tax=Primorskyibacter flagellatus TaxID=1387277 RepID=A0A917EJ80_9RHOB|nr:RNA pyrophosphohydrolase [Primorskyibacter flagellatus]GGE42214.1 RNA pyrophosphohydrolase [Primorskyibacter flagellatus]